MKSSAIVFALAILAPFAAIAATPDTAVLAAHPQCTVASGMLVVRGAVVSEPGDAPVDGAVVTLRTSAGNTLRGRTNASGIYTAVSRAPVAAGATVREVATSIPAPTGTLVPVQAHQAGGVCRVAAVSVGPILR